MKACHNPRVHWLLLNMAHFHRLRISLVHATLLLAVYASLKLAHTVKISQLPASKQNPVHKGTRRRKFVTQSETDSLF